MPKLQLMMTPLYRHPELPRVKEKTALELKAEELDIAYVELNGDIAVMANGAGITMATWIWFSITAVLLPTSLILAAALMQ
jgi:succinyl-CoA synthetase beta subunit